MIQQDIEKARRLAPEAEVFALVVLTHVFDAIPASQKGLVTYHGWLAKVADQQEARTRLNAFLSRLGSTDSQRLGNGEAFGVKAAVEAWLCGPTDQKKK